MDYSNNPGNNLVPGDFNLNLLVDLYGTSIQPLGSTATGVDVPASPPTGAPTPPVNNEKNNDDEDDRKVRRRLSDEEEALTLFNRIARDFEDKCEYEYCRGDLLGNGYYIQVNKKLVA